MESGHEEDAGHVVDAVGIVEVGGKGNVKETGVSRVRLALFGRKSPRGLAVP